MQGHPPSYRTYWFAWLVLLGVTLVMVATNDPLVLLPGIAAKAAIIALVFMHLREERASLSVPLSVAVIASAFVLFFLLVPDGRAS